MSEVSSNKRIAKNTALLYVRNLLTLLMALYTSRLTLQVLGVTDYGIYAAVGGVTSVLTIITTSLSSSSQRFITYSLGQGDYDKLNRTYLSSINIHIIVSLLFLVLAETIGLWFLYHKMIIPEERLGIAFWVFQFAILTAVFGIINSPNTAEIVAHEDMGTFALLSIMEASLRLLGVIALFFISWDKLLLYAIILFVISLLNPFVATCYCRWKYIECRFRIIWEKSLMKSMIGLAGWNALTSLAILGFVQGTNVLLNVFFGPLINSAYAVASQAYSGIRTFSSNFQLASSPQIVKLYSLNEIQDMNILLMRVCKFSFYLIFVLSFPFILNANIVLSLWLGVVPAHSESFFILLLIFSYVDVLAYPLDVAAQATGKLKKYSICVSICIASILPISYFLFKYGAIPEAVLYVAFLVAIIGILIRCYLLRTMIAFSVKDFAKIVMVRPLVSSLIVILLTLPIKLYLGEMSLIQSALLFIYVFVIEGIVIYAVGLDKTERSILTTALQNVKNKFV